MTKLEDNTTHTHEGKSIFLRVNNEINKQADRGEKRQITTLSIFDHKIRNYHSPNTFLNVVRSTNKIIKLFYYYFEEKKTINGVIINKNSIFKN